MSIITETVTFPSGSHQLAAYFARPDVPGCFPGVVVIHEIYGLNENIKDIARRFAEAGYASLAVDLFKGRNQVVCILRFFIGLMFNSLGHSGIADMKAALTFLGNQPSVDSTRLGAIGFCMGGGFAIALACTDERLKVIAPYYSTNPRPLAAVSRACPVVGSYPAKDLTAEMGRKLDAALEEYGIRHDIKVYPDTRHSFFNDRGSAYDAAAAQDSWERVLTFFQAHIGVMNAEL